MQNKPTFANDAPILSNMNPNLKWKSLFMPRRTSILYLFPFRRTRCSLELASPGGKTNFGKQIKAWLDSRGRQARTSSSRCRSGAIAQETDTRVAA